MPGKKQSEKVEKPIDVVQVESAVLAPVVAVQPRAPSSKWKAPAIVLIVILIGSVFSLAHYYSSLWPMECYQCRYSYSNSFIFIWLILKMLWFAVGFLIRTVHRWIPTVVVKINAQYSVPKWKRVLLTSPTAVHCISASLTNRPAVPSNWNTPLCATASPTTRYLTSSSWAKTIEPTKAVVKEWFIQMWPVLPWISPLSASSAAHGVVVIQMYQGKDGEVLSSTRSTSSNKQKSRVWVSGNLCWISFILTRLSLYLSNLSICNKNCDSFEIKFSVFHLNNTRPPYFLSLTFNRSPW